MDSTLKGLFRNLHTLDKAKKRELTINVMGHRGEIRYWIKIISQLTLAERDCLEKILEYRDAKFATRQ
jgi:hypothetical protein